MPIVQIPSAGTAGVIKDRAPYDLPPDAWSEIQNVRFRHGEAQKFEGHEQALGTPTVAPYWALPVQQPTVYYWLYTGLDKTYVTDGTTHTNITKQTAGVDTDWTGAASDRWTGGIINGIPFVNNGVDAPQMWSPVSTSQRMQDLTAWPASTTCGSLRPFREYLVALDVTKSSTRYPHMVKWSDAASAGAVPASWDETDATIDAGETSLSQTPGYLIDGLTLRDTFIIYKEDSTWGMQYVGGQFIFRFYQIFRSSGILAKNCVVAFEGKHCVLTQGDLIVHDGQTFTSIVDGRMREWLFNSIDTTNYAKSFLVSNPAESEILACFPSSGSTDCDTALVWNWRENHFSLVELPDVTHAAVGVVDPAESTTWATDTETWADDTTTWSERAYNPANPQELAVSPSNTKLYLLDESNQFDGTNMTAYAERTGLTFGDISAIKRVKTIYPRIRANNGVAVSVYVGHQMEIGDPISYDGPFTFTVGTDKKVDCRVTGRLIAVKFQTTTDVAWALTGYDMEVETVGKR